MTQKNKTRPANKTARPKSSNTPTPVAVQNAKALKPQSDPLNVRIIRPVSTRISSRLVHTGISPNQVTLFALLLAIVAAYLAAGIHAFPVRLAAALLAYFYLVFDCVDGELARLLGKTSAFGHWFDGVVDTVATTLLLSALAFSASTQYGNVAFWWGLAAALGFNAANFSYQYGKLILPQPAQTAPAASSGQPPLSLKAMVAGFSPGLQMLLIAAGILFQLPLVALMIFAAWANGLWVARVLKYHAAYK